MEIYLFIALFFVYILTSFVLSYKMLQRVWTIAFIASFAITGIAIFYIKMYANETLMKVGELNWYYVLYVFGSISIILGVINMWLYKKGLIDMFSKDDEIKDDE